MSVLTSVSGFPRIGQNRELKKIIEAYWKGVATLDDVRAPPRSCAPSIGSCSRKPESI